ncbi:MAG: hypothetical protein L0177_17150 [Chloroflexi bacterium]|nr:hypothetical protein [Chloroflexota bacterium]
MGDDIIGMDDMMAIYEVTDRFDIDRESISVPLEKEGDGSVTRNLDGTLEITVPAVKPTREWLPVLEARLKQLGFLLAEDEDEF